MVDPLHTTATALPETALGRAARAGEGPAALALSRAATVLDDRAARSTAELPTAALSARRATIPRATGQLDLFIWTFQQAFGYDTPDTLTAELLEAAPHTAAGWQEFELGFHEGTLAGFRAGFDELIAPFTWLRDAGKELLALAFRDEQGQQALARALIEDALSGVEPLQGETAAVFEQRYPTLGALTRGYAVLIAVQDALLSFLTAPGEGSFLALLTMANVTIARMLGEALREFVTDFVAQANKPKAQGMMVGMLYGRVGFEVATELVTIPVKPASAAVRGGKVARWASTAAGNLVDSVAAVGLRFNLIDRRFSIRRAIRRGLTLEKVLHEAYRDLRGVTARYGTLHYRTGEFNRFFKELASKSGWPHTDLIRLDAHHPFEARMFRHLKDHPGFKPAFQQLGWASENDMLAVALETELHLSKGSTLAETFKLTNEPAIVNLKSLTSALINDIGPPDQYTSFAQLLAKYEDFYRKPITIKPPTGPLRQIAPLWSLVEPAFKEMHQQLGLPPP